MTNAQTHGDVRKRLDRVQWRSLIVGAAALTACAIGAVFDSSQFFRAYLTSYLFIAGLALGSLALVMIHNLTGGAWGIFVRRLAEGQMKTLPLNAVMFVPVVLGLPHIYSWASTYAESAETAGTGESLWSGYLEPRFFCLRAVVYFVVWIALMALMSGWSRRQDESPDARTYWKAYKFSGFGLLLLGITLHFAAIDWIMSLQSGFTSTIFGPLVFSSQLLSGLALCLILMCWFDSSEYASILSTKVMNDLGRLLFTLLGLWAYLAWFQYMLIWIADLPRDNVWYLVRGRGVWRWLAVYLVVSHFAIPFTLLLFRGVKQNRVWLARVAGVILVGQWIFTCYQVMPVYESSSLMRHWMDVLMPLGLGGIWFGCTLWLLKRRPLLPIHDLNYVHAAHLHELDMEEMAREETLAHV